MVMWGTNLSSHTNPTWDPMSEETVDAAHTPPHTLGRKWDLVRIYEDNGYGPKLPVSGASHHAAGRALVLSVGKVYYNKSCLPGSTTNGLHVASEAMWDAFLDALLGFGANALTFTGSAAQLVYLIVQHEFDTASKNQQWGVPADYVAYYRRVQARYLAALTRHSITRHASGDRVQFGWMPTQYAMRGYGTNGSCMASPYYPGDAYVDFTGSDGYNTAGWGIAGQGAWNANAWQSFSGLFTDTLKFATDHDKYIILGEFDTVEWNYNITLTTQGSGYDPAKSAQWFTDAAVWLNANPRIKGLCFFNGGSTDQNGQQDRYDWGIFPVKHEAVRQAILATVGTPTGSLPRSPVNVAGTSSADGTSITMTWTPPPSSDGVTSYDLYIAPASQPLTKKATVGGNGSAGSYTFFGLTPGTSYRFNIVFVNPVGRSGFSSTVPSLTTATPSVNGAPQVSSVTIGTGTSGTPGDLTATVVWSDPEGETCTLTFDWGDGSTPTVISTAVSPVVAAHTYTRSGIFTVAVTVTDPGGLSALSSGITPSVGSDTTDNYQLPRLLGGTPVRDLTSRVRQYQDAADRVLNSIATQVPTQPHNLMLGLTGCNFDPVGLGGSQVLTPTPGTLVAHKMQVQGDGTVSNLVFMLQALATGSGMAMSIFTADGTQRIADATSVDSLLTAAGGAVGYTRVPCEANLNPGDFVYVTLLIPTSTTTAPSIRGAVSGQVGFNGGLTSAQGLRSGFLSTSAMPAALSLASLAQAGAMWMGLEP